MNTQREGIITFSKRLEKEGKSKRKINRQKLRLREEVEDDLSGKGWKREKQ